MGVVSKLDWFNNYTHFSSGKHYAFISFKNEKTLTIIREVLFTLEN